MAEVIPVQNGGDFMSGGFGAGVFGGLLSGAKTFCTLPPHADSQ